VREHQRKIPGQRGEAALTAAGVMNLGITGENLLWAVQRIGLGNDLVFVGDDAEQAFTVRPTAKGKWEVFYQERGQKEDHNVFATESAACYYLLGELTYSQLRRGRIGILREPSGSAEQRFAVPSDGAP